MGERDKTNKHLEEAASLAKSERIAYWQHLGTQVIFEPADELVRRYCEKHGIQTKLDKTLGIFHRGSLPKDK
jgi:hypothetical protein